MHVQQETHPNASASLMIEFELWVPRATVASGVIEVIVEERQESVNVCGRLNPGNSRE
jgi:hypothetical protein